MMTDRHAVPLHTICDRHDRVLFRCKVKQMEPGYVDSRLHNYDELKLVRIEGGACIWNISGDDIPVEAGDLLLFNRLDFRFVKAVTSAEPLVTCQLCFYPAALYPNEDAARFFYCRPEGFRNRFGKDDPAAAVLRADFDAILDEIHADRPLRDEMILNLLSHMILRLAREFPDAHADDRTGSRALIADAIAYIAANPEADLSLPTLAARASMSEAHFSRSFKAYSGIPLREYVTRSRVFRVISRLRQEPERNILDIALDCGFNTSSGFYRAFGSVTGTTPRGFPGISEG